MRARPGRRPSAYCVTLRPRVRGHNSVPALVSSGGPLRVHTAVSDNTPADIRPESARRSRDRVLFVALAATAIALWIAGVGYHGVMHDARLYSLQALARLHPDLYGQDLYLRFGSQDRFTFFSP